MPRPLNNYLLCKEEVKEEEESSQFYVPKGERFKKVEIIYSSEEDISKGSFVKVPINSGEEITEGEETYLLIKRQDVIYVI
jgi:co-chaperonin GroES (HSP10)